MAKYTRGDETIEISDQDLKTYYGNDASKITNSGWSVAGTAPVAAKPQPIAPVGGTTDTYNEATGKYVSTPTLPQDVNDQASANNFINQDQDKLISSGVTDPAIRKSAQTVDEIVNGLKDQVTGSEPAPAKPNYEQKLKDLRSEKGVESLESQMNDLTSQEQEAEAQMRQLEAKNRFGKNSQVDQSVIEGRVSEDTRAARENLDFIKRQKNYLTNELNTKYSIINNMMKYAEMDYAAAKDKYDSDFTKNLQLINAASSIAENAKSSQEKDVDNARANLQTIANSITSGSMTYDTLPDDQKLLISKLETASGLPVGFIKGLQNKNPKAEIISTTTRTTADGSKYADVLTKDPATGAIKVVSTFLGKERVPSSGDGLTLTERKALQVEADRKSVQADVKVITGQDGKVDPTKMVKIRADIALNNPELLTWFDNAYEPKKVLNPTYKENQKLIFENKW